MHAYPSKTTKPFTSMQAGKQKQSKLSWTQVCSAMPGGKSRSTQLNNLVYIHAHSKESQCSTSVCQTHVWSVSKVCKEPTFPLRKSLPHTYTRCTAMLGKELAARSLVQPCLPLTFQAVFVQSPH